jgi:hypothetical protein
MVFGVLIVASKLLERLAANQPGATVFFKHRGPRTEATITYR